jgi:hypothetical protein
VNSSAASVDRYFPGFCGCGSGFQLLFRQTTSASKATPDLAFVGAKETQFSSTWAAFLN